MPFRSGPRHCGQSTANAGKVHKHIATKSQRRIVILLAIVHLLLRDRVGKRRGRFPRAAHYTAADSTGHLLTEAYGAAGHRSKSSWHRATARAAKGVATSGSSSRTSTAALRHEPSACWR